MLQKWERQPHRVGLLVGFVALPLAWWLRDALLQLGFGFGSGQVLRFQLLRFFALGAIPGAALGAGLSTALLALRQGRRRAAKLDLILYGALVTLLNLFCIAPIVRSGLQNASLQVELLGQPLPARTALLLATFLSTFPLHCALLMLFVGLFLRVRS